VFFFQAALLAGYLYAHLLITRSPPHLTGLIHLGVCVVAVICLPIGLSRLWGDPPAGEPYFWQLGMFATSIGLPFIAVSANAPLLQAWFARTGHPNARDPYFMYAASNLGSLIALLGYPFFLEPAFGLSALSHLWAYVFALLVISIGVSFFLMRGAQVGGASEAPAEPTATAASIPPTLLQRLSWTGLAFVPVGLMTAFTVHLTTDVASAPLLWVIPLALYLLTFVLVFRDSPFVSRDTLLFLHLVALVVALITLSQTRSESWFVTSSTGIAVLFTTAMLAHRTLYEARPATQYLTEFYLWMSFGGALGGLFTALVAPNIFTQIYEYPLLLALSMACRPGALNFSFTSPEEKKDELTMLWLIAAVGILAILWLPTLALSNGFTMGQWGTTALVVMVLGAALLANVHSPQRQTIVAILMCAALVWLPSSVNRGEAQRSFFGVYRVQPSEDGEYRILMHGTTLHGAQRFWGEEGNPVEDTTPATYYYPGSPIGKTIAKRREVLGAKKGRYGIVGLGAGSSACHMQEGETWRFFEIDPTVIKIAKDPKNFTFISKCQPDIDIVVGDARLTMAKEKDASFDLFIIDAFSSDAIPMHLLTSEAVTMYLNKLKSDGVVLLHTSNRYLDLESVLSATLRELPSGTAGIIVSDNEADGSYAQSTSNVVIFTKSEEALQPYRALSGVIELDDGGLRPWTDNYSDLLGPFMNRVRGR
jgi:hypothetical protein